MVVDICVDELKKFAAFSLFLSLRAFKGGNLGINNIIGQDLTCLHLTCLHLDFVRYQGRMFPIIN